MRAARQPPLAFHGQYIIPGFIDVHVHGVDGVDSLDDGEAISAIAAGCLVTASRRSARRRSRAARRRFGACSNRYGRRATLRPPRAARVLPAHLESNFINPEFRGAQPAGVFAESARRASTGAARRSARGLPPTADEEFSAADLLREIERAAADVGIVTLAPELDGGIDLVRWLSARGHRVSLGHSGATYDAGARGHCRRRPSRDASLQSHAAARPPLAGPGGRDSPGRGGCRRAHLRRLPRAPDPRPHGDRGERTVAHHGHYRRHGRLGPPGRGSRDSGRRTDYSRRIGSVSGGRHDSRQHPDDGRRFSDAGEKGRSVAGRRGDGLLDHSGAASSDSRATA